MSSLVVLLAWGVLCLLVATVVLGLLSLRKWLRVDAASAPIAKITMHVVLQATSIALWASFIVTANTWLAWVSFVVITAGQVFGDLLMFVSYRARHRLAGPVNYRAVAGDVLGFSRPVPALQAIVGALGWFTMLATCIMVSID